MIFFSHVRRSVSPIYLFVLSLGFFLAACSSNDRLILDEPKVVSKPEIEVNYAALTGDLPRTTDELPLPDQLIPNVRFWTHVFGVWDLNEVVYHDDEHLQLVYAKAQLTPASLGERYDSADRDFVRAYKSQLEYDLEALERAVNSGQSLNPVQQQRYDHIVSVAGREAINGLADRLRYQRGQKSRYANGLVTEGRYIELFKAMFRANNVPDSIAYLPHVESSFRLIAVSSANATGMWQFTKGAADIFMIDDAAIDERIDPVASARGAVRYMQSAHGYLNEWPLAITSYNHGIGGMRRAQREQGSDMGVLHDVYRGRNFGFASRNFYPELLAVKYISDNRDEFFPDVETASPLALSALVLKQPAYATNASRSLGYSIAQLKELNPALSESVWSDDRRIPTGTILWLPEDASQRFTSVISARDTDRLAQAIMTALPTPQL